MKSLYIITSVLVSIMSTTASAYVTQDRFAPFFHVGTYDMTYYGEYFTSKNNIGSTYGDVDKLLNGGSYTEFSNRLEGGYTFNMPVRAFMYGKLNYVSTESYNSPIVKSRSTTEFNALAAGAQYFLKTKTLLIIPEFLYEHNFEDYADNQNDPITSDASSAVQAGAYLASYIWKLKSEAYIGYRYHTEDISDLLLWSWRLALRMKSWSVTGALSGGVTVVDDGDKDYPYNRYQTLDGVNGGSYRHRSVNPQWIDVSVEGAYKIDDRMSMIIGGKQTVTGRNTAMGTSLLIGFAAEFGDNESGEQYNLQSDEFQPELENYDKSLFE